MNTENLYIIGAGGHAKVVCETANKLRVSSAGELIWVDDNVVMNGFSWQGFCVAAPLCYDSLNEQQFHVAIGDNGARQRVYLKAEKSGGVPFSIIHASAIISDYSTICAGAFIAANAIIAADVAVGNGVIINHAAIVDHESTVGKFSHIAPGASLAGGVCIGDRVMIGAGARILPHITIGDDAIIGAGAVVCRNVSKFDVVAGVPAKHLGKT